MIMVQLVRHDIVACLHECAQQLLLYAASMEVSGPSSSAAGTLSAMFGCASGSNILNVLRVGADFFSCQIARC